MKWNGVVGGGCCLIVGFAAAWVWGQGLRPHIHKDGKLDAAFVGRGSARPTEKLLKLVRHDPHAGAFRMPTDKEKIGLISQAGQTCPGVVTKAVLTPEQTVVPGQASLQAMGVGNWWTPAPGYEGMPGYLQMNGDYSGVSVNARAATTKTLLLSLTIKASKGDTFLLGIIGADGDEEQGRTITADEGVQTISYTYVPPEPGVFYFFLTPQDNFEWWFYSAEISVAK